MQSYSITGQPPMNISIDGSDSSFVTLDRDHDEDGRYESAVVRWLEQVAATASGRTILAAIQGFNPIRLTIIPTNVSTESEVVRSATGLFMAFRATSVDSLGMSRASGPGSAPNEILMHELVHCVRAMRTWNRPECVSSPRKRIRRY